MANEDLFKKVISHAKEYGYIFQSSEIYDGLSAVYVYAQNGVELKKNIREYWWRSIVFMHQNIVGIDAAILMHPTTWKASGHIDAFNDPLIDNKDSKKRYRADVLIEDYCEKLNIKAQKEIIKAKKRFGESFNEEEFVSTNSRVIKYKSQQKEILERMARSLENEDLADVKLLIEELGIADPLSGSKNWTGVKQFNLMFGTKLGASAESAMDLYLRPETAQGIFVNFLNVQKTGRMKIPFGIAQTGKAFRNEIVATIPPWFTCQLTQIIVRNILCGILYPLWIRVAELMFREQKVSLQDASIMSADTDTLNFKLLNENTPSFAWGV